MLYEYKSDSSINRGEQFYVLADSIEVINNEQIEIIFDGVSKEWYSSTKLQGRLSTSYQELKPYIFRLLANRNLLNRIAEKLIAYKKFGRRWLEISINNKEGLEVGQFIDNAENAEVTQRFIESIAVLSPRSEVSIVLNGYFSWEFLSKREIHFEDSLIELFTNEVHINVYNVGQGSLCAVCDVNQIPLLYFDMGGGFAWNRHTYANTLKLCWTKAQIIVLSHWDLDHLETARRAVHAGWSNFKDKIWIAPDQPLSPTYAKLAAHMSATGKLMIWPKSGIKSILVGNIELIKCVGPHKNHSGLALVVHNKSSNFKTLHPGDSAYKYVKVKSRKNLSGLIATHHGAEFDDTNAPVPISINGKIAYSYGAGNSYSHPKANAINAHSHGGWSNRKNTETSGHISYMLPNANASCVNCQGSNCDLSVLSYF